MQVKSAMKMPKQTEAWKNVEFTQAGLLEERDAISAVGAAVEAIWHRRQI